MALFDVPGWSISDEPVTVVPKRRKRSSGHDLDKVSSASANIEKLMEQLVGSSTAGSTSVTGVVSARCDQPPKKNRKRAKGNKNRPQPQILATLQGDAAQVAPGKKIKKDSPKGPIGEKATLTSLQHDMKQSLDGARFRWINEKLYKSDSTHAHAMMREDPAVFNDYHKGFRRQVSSWPSNPVSHYISVLSSYPEHTVIADLGCGDAALARALIPRGYNVMSFDLVSDRAFVIEADIFERLPLPGSDEDCDDGEESGQGHAQIANVVVCALSLMGTNWPNCIREAWRILRPDGELKIAEVASRFTNVRQFQSFIESFGFRHQSTDDSNTHFTLFEFKKTSRNPRGEKEWSKLLTRGDMLKPCEYKRR